MNKIKELYDYAYSDLGDKINRLKINVSWDVFVTLTESKYKGIDIVLNKQLPDNSIIIGLLN